MITSDYINKQIDKLLDMVEQGEGVAKPDVQSFNKLFKAYNGRIAEFVIMSHIAQRAVERAMGGGRKKNGNGKKSE
jgi:SMC interacting uncharacterized protein involved in chromosome segregation